MKVLRAKTAGFCFGVKRAVQTVYDSIEAAEGKRIYTYGPIIHNEIVTNDFASKGVSIIHDLNELKNLEAGTVIIRSHGISRKEEEFIRKSGFDIIDATCPFVKKIHNIVEEHSLAGEHIVIIGNPDHPEVKGIIGWTYDNYTVIQNVEEAKLFHPEASDLKIHIVAQTTFNYNKFQEIIEILEKKMYYISVSNTICSATKERQKEAFEVASVVDAMIVIGDKHSSNTQKLFEICKNACFNTYYIQTLDDLDLNLLGSVETVGITAGASTPNKILEEVQRECQN